MRATWLILAASCVVWCLCSCSDSLLRRTGDIVVESDESINSIEFNGAALSSVVGSKDGKYWEVAVEQVSDGRIEIVIHFSDKRKVIHFLSEPILARQTLIKVKDRKISEKGLAVYHF